MGVVVHKDHGLNPSCFQCYICGETVGVALIGARVKKFKEAGLADSSGKMNMNMGCIDKEPCDKCKDIMKQGIIFISVKDNDKEYRTGGWCAITEEAVNRMGITPPELLDSILKQRVCFIQDKVYDDLGFPRNENINNLK